MIDDKENMYLSKITGLEKAINELTIALQRANDLITEFARRELLVTMQNLSEDAYAAGWMIGLEQACVDLVERKMDSYGVLSGDALEKYREKLAELHVLAGGWWIFDEEIGREIFHAD